MFFHIISGSSTIYNKNQVLSTLILISAYTRQKTSSICPQFRKINTKIIYVLESSIKGFQKQCLSLGSERTQRAVGRSPAQFTTIRELFIRVSILTKKYRLPDEFWEMYISSKLGFTYLSLY